jgi:hypothetical protein
MTFDNLIFWPHKSDKNYSIMSSIFLDKENGIVLSVVAGPNLYCTGREEKMLNPTEKDFASFEVAIIDESKEESDFDVRGWQSREDINNIIKGYEKKEI